METQCEVCQKSIEKSKSELKRWKTSLCSKECMSKFYDKRLSVTCKVCTKPFLKREGQCKKSQSGFHFCSQSCSATFSNPKRRKKFCTVCRKPIEHHGKYCQKCKNDLYGNRTLGELRKLRSDAARYNMVRSHARTLYIKEKNSCAICNYDKHVEICHIKSISSFPDEATIYQINDKSNILMLCPNCHWEFDHAK